MATAELLKIKWERAEEQYGLYRPSAGDTTIAVHRQTSKRLDAALVAWEYIPARHSMLPEVILSDMAHWYTDIHDDWERVSWWLCRIHSSSRLSRQPVFAVTNYVLIQADDFLAADMRPHGLIELVLGEDRVVFPAPFPRWINLSVLRAFLEPLVARMHFAVKVQSSYNGGIIGHRLMRCESGFFIQVQFLSTPFFLGELSRSAPLHVASLHPVTERPRANAVLWSVVYIAGGNTLISSRVFERVGVHAKVALQEGLLQKFPDLENVNSDFVQVHWSIRSLEPVVNHAKVYYVLAVIDEELFDSVVVLKPGSATVLGCGSYFCPTEPRPGSSRKLGSMWSVGPKERSVHVIIMGRNSLVERW